MAKTWQDTRKYNHASLAAESLAAKPPGGWPETVQAERRLVEEIVHYSEQGRVYRCKDGHTTPDAQEAIYSWLAGVDRYHPDRRS